MMKAIEWTAYGGPDVLRLTQVARPIPQPDELLIKVVATTVTAGDTELRSLKVQPWVRLPLRLYFGWRRPRRVPILGMAFSGIVAAVGEAVTRFQPGDAVFGGTDLAFGAYAEYLTLSENSFVTHLPPGISHAEATAVPVGGMEALQALRLAQVQAGEQVLIIGAGGTIGTYALQLAKQAGAVVTGVDLAAKFPMLRSLGADHLIDYTREKIGQQGERYACIIDVVGKGTFSEALRVLTPNGRYLMINPSFSQLLRGWWIKRTSQKQILFGSSEQKLSDLVDLRELMGSGELKSVIDDRRFPLEEMVEAHRFAEGGQKLGNIVITVAE